jgi:hypothetical protein
LTSFSAAEAYIAYPLVERFELLPNITSINLLPRLDSVTLRVISAHTILGGAFGAVAGAYTSYKVSKNYWKDSIQESRQDYEQSKPAAEESVSKPSLSSRACLALSAAATGFLNRAWKKSAVPQPAPVAIKAAPAPVDEKTWDNGERPPPIHGWK